jgi:hypothetical protein
MPCARQLAVSFAYTEGLRIPPQEAAAINPAEAQASSTTPFNLKASSVEWGSAWDAIMKSSARTRP